MSKPREWLTNPDLIQPIPNLYQGQPGVVLVREVLPDTVTITREEFRRACKKFEYDSHGALTSISDVERELFDRP